MGSERDYRRRLQKLNPKIKGRERRSRSRKVREETIQQANPALCLKETLIPKPILSTGLGGWAERSSGMKVTIARRLAEWALFIWTSASHANLLNTMGTNPSGLPETVPAERQTLSDKGNLKEIKKKKPPYLDYFRRTTKIGQAFFTIESIKPQSNVAIHTKGSLSISSQAAPKQGISRATFVICNETCDRDTCIHALLLSG